MNNLQYVNFANDDMTLDDDIDGLFSQLAQIQPPASLVESIMQAVANLPAAYHMPIISFRDDEAEGLLIHNEHFQAS